LNSETRPQLRDIFSQRLIGRPRCFSQAFNSFLLSEVVISDVPGADMPGGVALMAFGSLDGVSEIWSKGE
jgi:hypothetical protein